MTERKVAALMDRMAELKPCPFCGGEAEITEYHLSYEVECSACEATIAASLSFYADDDERISVRNELVKAWNRRDGERHGDE
nr:MAG TPA: restriction alleviation protein [Caudoviricetes sp.]